MKTPTLHDVARHAGVSYSTADRVLNRRGNVAAKSLQRVEDAMAALGYVRNVAAANLSKNRMQRLAFVLPRRSHVFFDRLHAQLERTALHMRVARVAIEIVEYEAFDPAALDAALLGLVSKNCDGVAFVGLGEDAAALTLRTLRDAGTKVVSLVSDGPQEGRDHYIGIDNVKAGRTAARLIGMAHGGQSGQVVLAAGGLTARDHSDRIAGFRQVLTADFPKIAVSQVIETRDQPDAMRAQLQARLLESDTVTAVYNVGAGSEGLIDAVQTLDRADALFCVVHELSDTIRAALEEGIIDVAIDQRPEIEMNRALALLQAVANDLPPPPSPELIPAIYVRDNLPNDPL